MRYQSVNAHAFGPFTGKTLSLAPGLNVIHGPNEAGKSTLHAALYAGLCGLRRGQGKPSAKEKAFAELHKPWDGAAWEVGAVVSLEDGRAVELRHNLLTKTCKATDTTLGTAVSVPVGAGADTAADGSRWLGLDRKAFLATACVRQGDLLGVLDDPDTLSTHIQRAAATAGTDATAAQALALIDKFRANNVGIDKANAVKPLHRAVERVEAARDALREAQAQHAGYAALVARARELQQQEANAKLAIQLVEARLASADAASTRQRAERASALAALFPNGAPTGLLEQEALAAQVTRALQSVAEVPPTAVGRVVSLPVLAAGGVLAAIGLALLATGQPAMGAIALVLGVGLLGWALIRPRGASSANNAGGAGSAGGTGTAAARAAAQGAQDALRQSFEQQQRWAELQGLLQGRTLVETQEEARRKEESARSHAQGLDPASVAATTLEPDPDAQLARLRSALADVSAAHHALRGEIKRVEETTISVPAAEEELAAAQEELDRVRQLDRTLQRTRELLARAEERVHRDVAPVLAADVKDSIARVTGGRYTDARVDPSSLEVTVRGGDGHWRRAASLSRGTAEQVYLLLRAALAVRLTKEGEVCPLILDDPTVHCDAARKAQVLDTLHALSGDRQIILFTQEDAVLRWAEEHLTGERDRLIRLAPEPVPA
jgi:DNA repair exonuclease SbcCD ATPase subunit